MTLSLKAIFLAGALFAAIGFVVITLLNLLLWRVLGPAFFAISRLRSGQLADRNNCWLALFTLGRRSFGLAFRLAL